MVQSWFVINELDHSILHQKLNGVITQASARTKYLPSWFGIPYLESTYFGGHLPTMMAIYTYPYHWWWYNCDRMRTECEHTRRLNRLVSKIIERTFQKNMAFAPQYTATVSKFLQTFFGILIISADSRLDMADVFFFKHQKSSSNMWLEPKLDPYPFRHISWCLSKTRSSTCSVSTYIMYGVYLYI